MEIFDLGIIGGGPAGYSAAIRAAQRGLNVVLFEKGCMGGVCLNRGCIPTKAILHCTDFFKSLKKATKFGVSIENATVDYSKIFERKNDVVQKIQKSLTKLVEGYGVNIVYAEASIESENTIVAAETTFNCKNIIVSTGSKPVNLTFSGLDNNNKIVLNSNDILELEEIPERILVVGSGAIGLEWSRIFSALGKTVYVVELADRLLPLADVDVSKRVERLFKKDKIKFFTGTKIESVSINNTGVSVSLDNSQCFDVDLILSAVGRVPVLPTTELDLEMNGKFVKVDEFYRTNYKNIFVVGDANGKLQLAHSAVHQALSVVDYLTGKKTEVLNVKNVPSVIYGSPEIAWVGLNEEELKDKNDYKVFSFPVAALGKAQADDEIDGLVKVLSVNDVIVGAHVVSPEASSLVQQFALMIDNKISVNDIKNTVFAHPTYSEAVFESILGLDNEAISLPKVNL